MYTLKKKIARYLQTPCTGSCGNDIVDKREDVIFLNFQLILYQCLLAVNLDLAAHANIKSLFICACLSSVVRR